MHPDRRAVDSQPATQPGIGTGGYASEVAATLGELVFEYLDAPIMRVAGKDAPIPASINLESEVVPREADIVRMVRTVRVRREVDRRMHAW